MTAKWLLIGVLSLLILVGTVSAGTYEITYTNITQVNDTLYLDFVDSVSNATVTFTNPRVVSFDNANGGYWTKANKFVFNAPLSEYANYKIVINGSTWELYNVTGSLEASLLDTEFWSMVKSDGSDIRICNQSKTQEGQLYFLVESWDYANQTATIWVNVSIGSSELNIAYGNPSALPSNYNNLTQVFNVSTDFEQTFDSFTPFGTSYEFNSTIKKSGQYSLRTYDAGEDVGAEYTFTVPSNKIIITEYVYITGSTLAHLFAFKDSAGNWIGPSVTIGQTAGVLNLGTPDTQIYYYSGGWVATGVYLTTNAWNKLTIVIDIASQTWDLYLNDSLVLSGKPFIASMSAGATATFVFDLNGVTTATVPDVYFDAVYIPKLADPTDVSSTEHYDLVVQNPKLILNGNIIEYNGTLPASQSVTLSIPSNYFVSGANNITITSVNMVVMDVVIKFDYLFSASVTTKDYFNYMERQFTVDTAGLATNVNLTVVFPMRTSDYTYNITTDPSAAYTITNSSDILIKFDLAPNTTYSLDLEIGYLIAKFTAKDEETLSDLSSFTITYESLYGSQSKSGATIKLYGSDLKLSKTEIIVTASATNYEPRKRIIDTQTLNQSITIYLLSSSSATYVTFTIVDGISTVYMAKVTIQKYINGDYVIISEAYTDQAGAVSFPLKAYDVYRIIVEKSGYQKVILDIEINRNQYTIQIGGGGFTWGETEPIVAYYILYPIGSTLTEGNITFKFSVTPKSGYTLSEIGIRLYINGTLVAEDIKYNIASSSFVNVTHYVNSSMKILVEAWYKYSENTRVVKRTYVVPSAVGLWAVFVALNNELNSIEEGKTIALLIAIFITLVVVTALANYTSIPMRGLGLVALILFTTISLALNAVPISVIALTWLASLAVIAWRW